MKVLSLAEMTTCKTKFLTHEKAPIPKYPPKLKALVRAYRKQKDFVVGCCLQNRFKNKQNSGTQHISIGVKNVSGFC